MSIQCLAGFQGTGMCDPGMHDSIDRHRQDWDSHHVNMGHSSHLHFGASSRPHGCAKRGGRPVTWIGGGGMDPKKLAGLGVPALRALFAEVFGEATASNNAGWLRRKLAESPDQVHGQRRSPVVRARDSGAAIWNSSNPAVVMMGGDGEANCMDSEMWDHPEYEDMQQQDAAMDSSLTEQGTLQGTATSVGQTRVGGQTMDVFGAPLGSLLDGCGVPRRSLKRSAPSAESADTLGYHSSAATRLSPAPSGSGSASPTATGRPRSPPRYKACSGSQGQPPHLQPHLRQLHNGCAPQQGSMILPHSFNDSYLGMKVLVYWPADHQWWAATICQLDTAEKKMQLLYTDMTEEEVSGTDFEELLRNRHLMLAGLQGPGYTNCSTGTLPVAGGETSLPQPSTAAAAAAADTAEMAWTACATDKEPFRGVGRTQSCVLPQSIACSADVSRDISRSASLGAVSAGTGSAEGSGVGGDPGPLYTELAAKRLCCDLSAVTSGSADPTADRLAGSDAQISEESRQQVQQLQQGDASQLGTWFATQQRQQLQLQQQVPDNLQYQQQAQLQMHQHMAAHMQMQHIAGQVLHMQLPAACAPAALTSCTVPQGPSAAAVSAASLPAAVAGSSAVHGDAVGCGGLAEEIQQLRQLQLRLQETVSTSDAAASGWPCLPACQAPADGADRQLDGAQLTKVVCGLQEKLPMHQNYPNQVELSMQLPPVGCLPMAGSAAASAVIKQDQPIVAAVADDVAERASCPLHGQGGPRASDACAMQQPSTNLAVPELGEATVSPACANLAFSACAGLSPVAHAAAAEATAAAGAGANMQGHMQHQDTAGCTSAASMGLEGFAKGLQDAAGDDIDTLLSKSEPNMFNLSNFGCKSEDDENLDDSFGPRTSSCGDSLCESMADELAVAGFAADDAATYYSLFGAEGLLAEHQTGQAGSEQDVVANEDADAVAVTTQAEQESFAHMFDFD